jgi:hypothetical protein
MTIVKAVFWGYLLVVVVGIAYFLALGLRHA